jgi:hypothetical protein
METTVFVSPPAASAIAPRRKVLLEDKLDSAANAFFGAGLIGCVVCLLVALVPLALPKAEPSLLTGVCLLAAAGSAVNGWLFSLLLRWAGEVLRQLRKAEL